MQLVPPFTPSVGDGLTGWLSAGVESAPVAAALETSVGLGRSLAALHATADRFNVNKFHRFSAAGLQPDDFAEAMERLSCLVHCYEPDT